MTSRTMNSSPADYLNGTLQDPPQTGQQATPTVPAVRPDRSRSRDREHEEIQPRDAFNGNPPPLANATTFRNGIHPLNPNFPTRTRSRSREYAERPARNSTAVTSDTVDDSALHESPSGDQDI